jgi:hypothetical protein
MVVGDAHLMRVAAHPAENEPPLVVDSNAVKTTQLSA